MAHDVDWGLRWVSDFNHGIGLSLRLALLAQVEVGSDSAPVSDSDDRIGITLVTDESVVNGLRLVLRGFLLLIELLVLLGAVVFDLLGKKLLELEEEFVTDFSRTSTLLAKFSSLIDLLSIALEAVNELLLVLDSLFIVLSLVERKRRALGVS